MRRLLAFFAVALLATTSIESASAQFTNDFDAFNACVAGTPIRPLAELRADDGQLITDIFEETGEFEGAIDLDNQVLSSGSFSFSSQPLQTQIGDLFDLEDAIQFALVDETPLEFMPNPALGTLNGFCIRHFGLRAQIRVLDGDREVDSFTVEASMAPEFSGGIETDVVCWKNPTGENVTSIEITALLSPNVGTGGESIFVIFSDLELRFEPEVEPEDPSSFEKLGDVVTRLELFTMSLEGSDADKAECALDLLEFVSDEVFFELPEGERLSRYGSTVFLGSAYAIHHLNKIDNEEAHLLAEDVICVLEDVVDFEIAYAIENGGRADFIERAEDIAAVAEFIDEDIDNDAIAALVYRRAWLFAFCSTY